MKFQVNSGFNVPAHHWIGFRAKRDVIAMIERGDVTIPKGSNLEGLEPHEGGGVLVRWKQNMLCVLPKAALFPLTAAAREFLRACA